MNLILSGKFGFLAEFGMISDDMLTPPHSTSHLGLSTVISWRRFISRTPQNNTCKKNSIGMDYITVEITQNFKDY